MAVIILSMRRVVKIENLNEIKKEERMNIMKAVKRTKQQQQ
jgi:hypothetical protein